MRALILTAGLGTRLRPLTYVRAKGAVPVNGTPIVTRVVAWLVSEGLDELVVNLHHLPASITGIVGDGAQLGARVRYSWEQPVLGSAGGPRRALPLLVDGTRPDDERFLVVNGDTLTDVRLRALIDAHAAARAAVTMALVPNPRPDLYGGAIVEGRHVAGFTGRGSARESFHFVGVQVVEARVFAGLDDGVPAESVMQVYPELIRREPHAILAHVVDADFQDIGTPADYLQTSLELAAREGDRLAAGARVEIHPSAELRATAVWDDVTIGAGSSLHECIVCDGVRLPESSRYARSAIVPWRGGAAPPRPGERVEGPLLVRPF